LNHITGKVSLADDHQVPANLLPFLPGVKKSETQTNFNGWWSIYGLLKETSSFIVYCLLFI
jgi:hypothetical protein